MKASVIVPAWGDTPYLEEVKARLAAQTLRDFEVVVVAPRGAVHAPDRRRADAGGGARAADLDF